MSIGERYVNIYCDCGHEVMLRPSTHPKLFGGNGELLDEVWSRLRCSKFGRRGASDQRLGWVTFNSGGYGPMTSDKVPKENE